MRSCYIAGPMSGIPQFNFPAFDAAAKRLRGLGIEVISPAELDDEATRAAAMASPDGDPSNRDHTGGKTWTDFLARDLRVVIEQCDRIALLPGWQRSRGARLEAFTGLLCRYTFYKYDRMVGAIPMDYWEVKERIL